MEKLSKSEKIEKGQLFVRAILEIVGKPKEHVENTLKEHIGKIKEDKNFEIVEETMEEAEENENKVFTTFAELEIWIAGFNELTGFCFDYMPSSVEIIEPESKIIKSHQITDLFNDLQARIHHVDMLAKQLHQENQAFNSSLNAMIKNNILIALANKNLKLEQLSKFAGVNEENLKKFVDVLVEEKRIMENDGVYSLNKEKLKKESKKDE